MFLERKSIRKSTAVKSAETLRRMTERSTSKRRLLKKRKHFHMTQEERLREAKFTEIENLKSLRKCVSFMRRNLLKKRFVENCLKKRARRRSWKSLSTVPMVFVVSLLMNSWH